MLSKNQSLNVILVLKFKKNCYDYLPQTPIPTLRSSPQAPVLPLLKI